MSQSLKIGEKLGQRVTMSWGVVIIAIATILGLLGYFVSPWTLKIITVILVIVVLILIVIDLRLDNPPVVISSAVATTNEAPNPPSIVLLYKHDKPLDDSVATVLESLLTQAGHSVFLDHQKSLDQLQAALQHAEAVLILLTQEVRYSDLLESKVEQACQIINDRAGHKPPIISIRLQFEEEIPLTHLAELLNNRPAIAWNDVHNISQLSQDLMSQLTPVPVETPTGAIPMVSKFYIKRPEDEKLRQAIGSHDSVILVRGSRQVGKTSLLVRGLQIARDAGMPVWFTAYLST